jgi:transcriptional regulator with XRE-family HTH domain
MHFVEYTPWRNTLQGGVLGSMSTRDTLALNLRRFRNLKGFTQEELSDHANVDRSYISELENSKSSASIDMINRLANGLGIDVSQLIGDDGLESSS